MTKSFYPFLVQQASSLVLLDSSFVFIEVR